MYVPTMKLKFYNLNKDQNSIYGETELRVVDTQC